MSTEGPDPIGLHELVDAHLVHGPFGPLDRNCTCMKDGLCTRNYLKQTRVNTAVNVNGDPEYRRRDVWSVACEVPMSSQRRGVRLHKTCKYVYILMRHMARTPPPPGFVC